MKKTITLVLTLFLITGLLAGCSNGNGNQSATSELPMGNVERQTSAPADSRSEPERQEAAEPDGEAGNLDKALALIGSFASGDASIPREYLAEEYIQHNLDYGTGRDAFVGAVEHLGSADVATTVRNIRAFEDGDYVFLHNLYNFAGAGEQVAIDVFRFENGKIAEHWDNLAFVGEPNPSGRTQTDGPTAASDLDKTEENKALAEQFVKDVLMGRNPHALTDYFDGDAYIQHNPGIADGLSGLGEALAGMAEAGIEMIYDEIHLVLGQGSYVLAVSEGSFGGEHTAYFDLWRMEDGKIAEHWDVVAPVPDESEWENQNGKF